MHVTCAYHFTRADALILPYTHVALCPIVHVQYLRVASVKGHIHGCADASRYVSAVGVWEYVNACAPVYVCVHVVTAFVHVRFVGYGVLVALQLDFMGQGKLNTLRPIRPH